MQGSLIELQYEDNIMISTLLEEDTQAVLEASAEAYCRACIDINVKKTQVLSKPAPD